MKVTALDVETMARTIYGEARGEKTDLGRQAVGHVIINRAEKGGWWGKTISQVCLHPSQFSAWNHGDPNRAKMQAVDLGDPAYRKCMWAALQALRERDPTDGATHYATHAAEPYWAKGLSYTSLGGHRFYKGVP